MLSLDEAANVARIDATFKTHQPEFVVFDPWGGLTANEDATAESRAALQVISHLGRRHGDPTIEIIAHGRTGAQNIAMGTGWNKGAFVKGAKVLYACARAVFNVMPGDPDDETKLVLSCGKSNNAPPFKPRGIVFNPGTFTFSVDPTFDLQEWKDDLEGNRTGKSLSIRQVCMAVQDGNRTRKDLVELFANAFDIKARTVDSRLREAVCKGYLMKIRPMGHYALGNKWNQ